MIANFFKESKPVNFLSLGFLSLIVFAVNVLVSFKGPFSLELFIKWVFYYFLFIFSLLFHNFIVRKNNLTQRNTYALLFFILMYALFPAASVHFKLVLSNVILFFAFRRIYSIRSGLDIKSKLFDSAMWIGLASIIYPWSALFLILIYISLFLFRKMFWNFFLIPLIGYATPIYLFWVYLLMKDRAGELQQVWHLSYSFDYRPYNQLSLLLPIAIVLVFILWTIFPTLSYALRAKKNVKNSFRLILFHLLLTVIVSLVAPLKNGSEFIFLFFPFSVLMANYLQRVKEYWFKESLIILFLLLTGVVIYFA